MTVCDLKVGQKGIIDNIYGNSHYPGVDTVKWCTIHVGDGTSVGTQVKVGNRSTYRQ